MITQEQKDQFFAGFIEALLWSSGGEADYGEAPEGYSVEQANSRGEIESGDGEAWYWIDEHGDSSEMVFPTERAAIVDAWEDSGEEPPMLDDLEDYDLADTTRQRLREYCDAWCDANAELLNQYTSKRDGKTPEYATAWGCAGHDFALTANCHGVGFWDRGLGELGDVLTAKAKADYRKLPSGYPTIEKISPRGWQMFDSGYAFISTHQTLLSAVMAAWKHSGQTPPENIGAIFECYVGDDGLIYVN